MANGETRLCTTCDERRAADAFPTPRARRCSDCWVRLYAKARCKHCDRQCGFNARNQPREFCHRPECQHERASRRRRGSRKPRGGSRVCSSCQKRRPLNDKHFHPERRGPDGETLRFSYYCHPCRRAYRRARYASEPHLRDEASAYKKTYRQTIKERRRKDPAFDREWRDKRNTWQRERRHAEPADVVELPRRPDEGGTLPVAPLVEAITRWLVGRDLGAVRELGIADRQWYAWRHGEFDAVSFGVADRVLINLHAASATGVLWWEVWTPGSGSYDRAAELFTGKKVAA